METISLSRLQGVRVFRRDNEGQGFLPTYVRAKVADLLTDTDEVASEHSAGWWLLEEISLVQQGLDISALTFFHEDFYGESYWVLLPATRIWHHLNDSHVAYEQATAWPDPTWESAGDLWILNVVELDDEALAYLGDKGEQYEAIKIVHYRL